MKYRGRGRKRGRGKERGRVKRRAREIIVKGKKAKKTKSVTEPSLEYRYEDTVNVSQSCRGNNRL